MTTNMYRKYSLEELQVLAKAAVPTPVNLVLDRETIDFLLSLNTNNRRLNSSAVESFLRSYDQIGWKSTETLCVTDESTLGNGQHRLTGLKQRNYPAGCCATVVFGADKESLLAVDQHSKRSASAAVKIAAGGNFSTNILAAIRHDILCNTETMSIAAAAVQPSELIDRLGTWEMYAKEMPLLFHQQVVGRKSVVLTSPMVLAVAHYRQRAGVDKANDFLLGFWGDKDRPATSPERKAMDFRLTTAQARGNVAISIVYRTFAWLLIAHYEGRRNPRIQQATDWGRLKTMRTR